MPGAVHHERAGHRLMVFSSVAYNPAVLRIYSLAITAYSNGFAFAGSCSASTTTQPSYPFSARMSNTGWKSKSPVARHRERACAHRVEEGVAPGFCLCHHVVAHALEVHVLDALRIISGAPAAHPRRRRRGGPCHRAGRPNSDRSAPSAGRSLLRSARPCPCGGAQ